MNRSLHFAACLILTAGVCAPAEKGPARNAPPPRPAAARAPEAARKGAPPGPQARPNPPAKRAPVEGIPGAAGSPLARWNQMTPAQREKALQSLPPERQQQIRDRLEKFNSLPPEERERLQRRYERFNSLPPARQDLVRRQIQNFTELPQDRRPEISREFDQLRRMTPKDRKARINSEEFRDHFSAKEREILRDLSENLSIPP